MRPILASFYLLVVLLLVITRCGGQQAVTDSATPVPAWEAWASKASSLEGVDTQFRFNNVNPAYEADTGPNVCIDEAHFNLHTAEGRFYPFAEMLRGDGYRVKGLRSRFREDALADCQILVIANAQNEVNTIGFDSPESNWSYPHPSAFDREEINELILWVRNGGSLFLIADHAPLPGAAADLAVLLGVHMLDGYAEGSRAEGLYGIVVFGTAFEEGWREAARLFEGTGAGYKIDVPSILANPGTLAPHPVVEGRNSEEHVRSVVTGGGQAFYATEDWEPILVFGPRAVTLIPLANIEDAEWEDGPLFSVAGWLQGATRHLGEGRVVILGESAMCTAQFDDFGRPGRNLPDGMNSPMASQNAQFCLNVVHWLSGLLDG